MKKLFLPFLFCLFLAGCETDSETPAPTPVIIDLRPFQDSVENLKKSTEKLENINKKIEDQKNKNLSKASAAARGVLEANKENPEGNPKKAVELEGGIVVSRLPEPEKEDLLEMLERVRLVLSGKLELASKMYDKAAAELTTEKIARAQAEKEKEVALKEKSDAVSAAEKKVADIELQSKTNKEGLITAHNIAMDGKDKEIARLGRANATKDWSDRAEYLGFFALLCFIGSYWYPRLLSFAVALLSGCIGSTMMSIFVGSKEFEKFSIWAGFITIIGIIIGGIVFYFTHKKENVKKQTAAENDMAAYVFGELHSAYEKAKVVSPEAAKIVGEVFKDELSNDSKLFIDKKSIEKKEKTMTQ